MEVKSWICLFEMDGVRDGGGKGREEKEKGGGGGRWGPEGQVVGWQSCGAFRRSERWIKCWGWMILVFVPLLTTRVPPFSTSSLLF